MCNLSRLDQLCHSPINTHSDTHSSSAICHWKNVCHWECKWESGTGDQICHSITIAALPCFTPYYGASSLTKSKMEATSISMEKNSSQHQDNQHHPNLPQELITIILSTLPVKSLVRFRCVSKSWLSLICSPEFIKAHLNKSSAKNNSTSYGLVLPIDICVKHYSLADVLNCNTTRAVGIDYPMNYVDTKVVIEGSCNGLLCISIGKNYTGEKDLFLWNPSIRKYKKLPDFKTKTKWEYSPTLGFGYDEANDDYKVVGIFWVGNGGGDAPYQSEVLVYSLKSDSWRNIENLKGAVPYAGESGKFVNGKLHWRMRYHSGSRYWRKIVSLDMLSLTYGEIEEAEYKKASCYSTLSVLGGCLAIDCHYRDTAESYIWMMEEYGVSESWTKVHVVHGFTMRCRAVYLFENGEFLLHLRQQNLAVYCTKENSSELCDIGNLEGICDPTVYMESLIPPTASNRAEH